MYLYLEWDSGAVLVLDDECPALRDLAALCDQYGPPSVVHLRERTDGGGERSVALLKP